MVGVVQLSRRHVLYGGLAVGATAVIPTSTNKESSAQAIPPEDAPEYHPFMHGVASGDPLTTSVILWTRVTPTPEATPGSEHGPPVELQWEIALDPSFVNLEKSGVAATSAEKDHTVHVDPFGLLPGTVYYYRFWFDGVASPVGRTKTAAENPEEVNLAVCSCANYEAGYFVAYRDMAERANRDEIDVIVHLGDYIYEDASGENPGKNGITRPFEPEWELVSGSDYRIRYGQYRQDPDLQAAHAATAWVVTWDDHELADDAHVAGAKHHKPEHGSWELRREAAMQAYFDWQPVRATNPAKGGRLYRSLAFGDLAELHMLDLRTYRSGPGIRTRTANSPEMLGSEQFTWLQDALSTTHARWSLIGNSVMISPLNTFGVDPTVRRAVTAIVGDDTLAELSPALNPDQWDGYPVDRQRLLEHIAASRPDASTVFLTGDIHSEWAMDVQYQGERIATELVCSSINAPNVDDTLRIPKRSPITRAAEEYVLRYNPHIHHVQLDDHGYLKVSLTHDVINAQWMRVSNVEDRAGSVTGGPTVSVTAAMTSER